MVTAIDSVEMILQQISLLCTGQKLSKFVGLAKQKAVEF